MPTPYPDQDQQTAEALAELEAYGQDLDDDARAIVCALLALHPARSPCVRLAPSSPVYQHTYGNARVRVLRDGHLLVFDANGHPLGDPIWDSHHPA
jgi:hypothetical protein